MAIKKKTLPPAPARDDDDDDLVADIPPAPPGQDAIDEGSEAELSQILADLGGATDASISVKKVTMQGEAYIGKFMPSEFDLEKIRDRYGGGTFWFYVHAGGKIKHKRRVIFAQTIDEQRGGDSGARSTSVQAGATDMATVLDKMAQQMQSQLQMVITALTANRTPATDPATIIDLASKLSNLGNRGSGGGEDSFEKFMRIAKFAREFGSGGGGESDASGLIGVAREFIGAMREAPSQQLPAPSLGPNGGEGTTTGDPQQMMFLIQRALAARLPMLIRGAQAETDPGVYAQLVLDQMPELYVTPMVRELQKPEWFALLVKVDGRVVPHQPWFEALRNEILQATSPESPPAP